MNMIQIELQYFGYLDLLLNHLFVTLSYVFVVTTIISLEIAQIRG